ncbi:MAG: type II toxin-antitoxin system VapC family toxin [Alphaproteobacteria bacterium]|nr:type II toxin-antitoxin system VapC family toxin [Alphaproteobacteria bacterium]
MIWVLQEPAQLSTRVRDILAAAETGILVSAASLWEAAIKQAVGKMQLPAPASQWLPYALDRMRIDVLDMTGGHALTAGSLPRLHGDPFDRMLVAQAVMEKLTLVTRDRAIRRYEVETLEP